MVVGSSVSWNGPKGRLPLGPHLPGILVTQPPCNAFHALGSLASSG